MKLKNLTRDLNKVGSRWGSRNGRKIFFFDFSVLEEQLWVVGDIEILSYQLFLLESYALLIYCLVNLGGFFSSKDRDR